MVTTSNPWNNEQIAQYQSTSESRLMEIAAYSAKVQADWAQLTIPARVAKVLALAQVLRMNSAALAVLAVREMGKPLREAQAEVEKCAWLCEYYAEKAESFLAAEHIVSDAGLSYIAWQPLGTVLAVMPWNFPYWQVFRFAVPALLAGNAGILKHASNVTGCSLAIEGLFVDAGFPEGLFKSVVCDATGVENLIKHPAIKAVTLTGSEFAGMQVAATAGRSLKKTVLELGGSDPFIVLDDADLELATTFAVKSRFINNGQSCIAAKRFIVTPGVYEKFVAEFARKISLLQIGDPMMETTEIGPMARPDLVTGLQQQVQRSIEAGAKLVSGCNIESRISPNLFVPGVLAEVKPGMPAYDEELFGPVAAVIRASDEQDAIRIANDTVYGLGASIWTADQQKGERLALQIEAGSVFVNGMVKSDPRLPFGGVKLSGYGRELSLLGMREFVNAKTVWVR